MCRNAMGGGGSVKFPDNDSRDVPKSGILLLV